MIDLKLLILIDKKLQKTKKSSFHLTTVFNRLFLIILIKKFYQFPSIPGKAYENYLINQEKIHGKSF